MALWKCSPIYMTFIFPLMIIVCFFPGFLSVSHYILIYLNPVGNNYWLSSFPLVAASRGHEGHLPRPPSQRLFLPPPPRSKISHFRQVFDFCPPETHFAPQCPHKNFCLGQPLLFKMIKIRTSAFCPGHAVLRVLFMEEGLSVIYDCQCSLIHRHNLGLRITVLGKP